MAVTDNVSEELALFVDGLSALGTPARRPLLLPLSLDDKHLQAWGSSMQVTEVRTTVVGTPWAGVDIL